MKNGIIFSLLIICIGLMVAAGCTSTGTTNATTQAMTIPTSAVPTQTPSPIATIETAIPTTTVAIVNQTPVANPDPIDVSKIQFTKYSDNDFSLEYPSTWNVSKSTYTQYICTPGSMTNMPAVSNTTTMCYYNEVQTIGPFDFGEYSDQMKKPARIVKFTSADGTHKVVAFTEDFLDNQNGNWIINPDLGWVQNLVLSDYPDVGFDEIGGYQYNQNGNTMCVRYTVTTTKSSAVYPLAFAMKSYVTMHHDYYFAYISNVTDIQKYHDLEEYIISSITPNDI